MTAPSTAFKYVLIDPEIADCGQFTLSHELEREMISAETFSPGKAKATVAEKTSLLPAVMKTGEPPLRKQ